ncbi:MAG: aspartate aminotransferase family protein [SAR324 cluster bacterium]|nr:aspartate aminotransferase family protein [SAR324 cluster bacterium]
MAKEETFEDLRQLTLDHTWVPARPWNVLNGPDGFNIFTEGKGCRITDIHGKTYLDIFSALGNVCSLGYGRKEIADAAYEQMMKLHFMPTHELNIPQIKLSKKLADLTPGSLSMVFYASSGTEAIESAIKIARKYQVLSGKPKKYKMIVGGHRYHGSTYGAMSVGSRKPHFSWEDYEPLLPGVISVPSPYCHRCDLGLKYPDCNIQCAREIERVIEQEGPDTVASFLDVTIATGYSTLPPPEYWPMVRAICDKYNVLLILDEIMMSLGRTGKWFGFEHWDGFVPDIIVLAKSLANGAVPLGATIVTREVAQKFEGGLREMLNHSYTFLGHPVACAAALVTLEIMEKEKVIENSRAMGTYLFESLSTLRKHRTVGEIRGGLGLDCTVEFVKNQETGEKFSPEENKKFMALLKKKIRQAGFWGAAGNPLKLLPPLVINKDEIDELVEGLDKVTGEIARELAIT